MRRVSSLFVAVLHLATTLVAAAEVEPSASERPAAADAMARGLSLYREGEYRLALETLEPARRERPADAELALLTGLVQLRLDRPADAVRDWRDAIELDPDARWTEDLRRSVTRVAREADRREARSRLAAAGKAATDAKTLAVLPFRAETAEDAPLARALGTMAAANLATLPGVSVVDPDRVDVFLAESGLAERATTEGGSARKLARALGAGRVLTGRLRREGGRSRLEARLYDSAKKRELGKFDAEAAEADFATLVPTLAPAVAAGLGAEGGDGLRESHTSSIPAATAFGRARELASRQEDSAARDEAERAVGEDSSFRLARDLRDRLPATSVSLVAVANSVESSVLPMLAEGKGGRGLGSGTMWLLGGAAVVAGAAGIALAVGGGSGGGGGDDADGPTLEGVRDASVIAGGVLRLDVTARSPGSAAVTLEADLAGLQPGATFTIVSDTGTTKSGRLDYRPVTSQVGVHTVTFTARTVGDSSATTTANARITVTPSGGAVTPSPGITPSTSATPTRTRTATPSPTATRTRTPTP